MRSTLALGLLILALAAIVGAIAAASDSDELPRPAATPVPRAGATSAPPPPVDDGQESLEPVPSPEPADPPIAWRDSRAVGLPWSGRLVRGVQLPHQGRDFFTWDPVQRRWHNRAWRRYGTDSLIRTLLKVLREHRAAHPNAPRVGVGDLSRPRGGDFGRRYGGLGHASHQNGLDVDVYYARKDGLELRPNRPSQVDRRLAQDLVDRFVKAGAEKVFVGPSLGLRGPRNVVVPLIHHDDHLHARIKPPPE